MKQSLSWRLTIILSTVLVAAVIVWLFPLHLGIDLAGGTSLLYELDTKNLEGNNSSELAERVVNVLKKRVDPGSQKNLIWRVLGNKRIQIQMPLADKATRDARAQYDDAIESLTKTTLRNSEVLSAISHTGEARTAAINALAAPGAPRNELMQKLATAYDDRKAAEDEAKNFPDQMNLPTPLVERLAKTREAYRVAQTDLDRTNADVNKLLGLLAASDNVRNTAAIDELKDLPAKYPSQKTEIDQVIAAYNKLKATSGGSYIDPAELQRLVTSSGVLDFRITVDPTDINQDQYDAAVRSLQQYGPRKSYQNMRWFQVDPNGRESFARGYVMAQWAGEPHVLLWDDPSRALTHSPTRKDWKLVDARKTSTPNGDLAVSFKLDAIGAGYFGDLTTNNLKHQMAILLDDKAISAPRIQSAIFDSGEITLGSGGSRPIELIRKEADTLVQILEAGSLPATLQKDPISVQRISPDLGEDNIKAGTRSAVYALIAVIAFMLVYYTITGVFADLALMVNLLLVLAVMAFIGGTFTLPGIAALVLTLGMAVDANVLINERIREEIHKGASLWMAVRQGYDKVFWTIFDANLTTSLTSIVLIYVGSEEVRGFGITLLIGLVIHMFTALFVTRTLMMAAIKWGVLRAIDDHSIAEYLREILTLTWLRRGHWPFMRVITITNFDWIGKRHIFWVVSAVITIAGIAAFVVRGEDKYDIEFRGGTQVTFQLKEGIKMPVDEVRKRVYEIPNLPDLTPAEHDELKDVAQARVYGIGTEGNKFELQTTIADTSTVKIKTRFLELLAQQFHDVLNVKPRLTVRDSQLADKDIGTLLEHSIVVPITRNTLDQVFADTPYTEMPNRDVTDYLNGAAIVLDGISPPLSAGQLTDRIRQARLSPEISNLIPNRAFKVIPVTAMADGKPVSAGEEDKRPLTRAVMVSVDPLVPYETDAALWQARVGATEWQVLKLALESASQFDGVTSFDAVVAAQAKMQALIAIVLSLILIVIYVWIRFGGLRYGIGAILSLAHDAVVALAATVLSGFVYNKVFGGHPNFLLITDFKINLTMIAAYLTVIGYSVNDTIVIFDRVRELRGRSHLPLSKKLVNDAINQCFGRTIWTTFTVFIVVLIMYIWGGEGVRGFSFAMLIGVLTGAYSTLAIASPALLSMKEKEKAGGTMAIKPVNPFISRPDPT